VCRDRAGDWDDRRRSERACRRIDLPVVEERPNVNLIMCGYLGRSAQPGLVEVAGKPVNPKLPLEDPADGCPGAWARSRFAHSIVPYLRRRTEGGGRVPNPLYDRCDDEFIWACVAHVEEQQERWSQRMWGS
jgi:hypothetical protein